MTTKTKTLIYCLKMIGKLFALSDGEGLKEAAESLKSITDYHCQSLLESAAPRSPQESTLLTGCVLPSEIRPPLILDLD